MTSAVTLAAPVDGWVGQLEEVPDEVFSTGMMGRGFAIDPLDGEITAPCDGTVAMMAPTGHALTIRTANGAEILIHVGLETVALAGEGFTTHVAAGQAIRQGDSMLSFDLDRVALAARSLITPIVVTNSESFDLRPLSLGRLVRRGEPLASIWPMGSDGADVVEMTMALAQGLHARPAARIADFARGYAAEVKLRAHGREANARSPVALMTLGLRLGDAFEITAAGADAGRASADLARFISAMSEASDGSATDREPATPRESPGTGAAGEIAGVCAVPGVAVGPAFHLRTRDPQIPEEGAGLASERERLATALRSVAESLGVAAADPDPMLSAMANAHRALLEDEELAAAAQQALSEGKSAAFAWRAAIRLYSERLRATADPLLNERVDDLLDLERQVVTATLGDEASASLELPEGAILLADNVLPSQWMKLDKSRAAGLCTAGGGPTSHVAIMAAACGIPMIVAAGRTLDDIPEGSTLLLDASAGRLVIDPDPRARDQAREAMRASGAQRESERAEALAEAATADGARIHILANLASAAEAREAVALGAEGCGLLRTEFLFLDRCEPPSEDEQRVAYQQIADALDGRPLIVRTLDVGGDKPLPYLPLPPEENPALGLRGVRASLWRPELLDEQLRAILRVEPPGRCRIMIPMVASLDELSRVRRRLEAVAAAMGHAPQIELGVMIETPAAALLADQLAAEADFLSIGSNDLTQYALAMDRGNPLVAAQVDAFHPAVLRLIAATVRGAEAHGRPVGVCGGLASDGAGALLLVGLGIAELSVAPAAVPMVKAALRRITLEQCRTLAKRALDEVSPAAVRRLAAGLLPGAAANWEARR